jgi:hypothetical protein
LAVQGSIEFRGAALWSTVVSPSTAHETSGSLQATERTGRTLPILTEVLLMAAPRLLVGASPHRGHTLERRRAEAGPVDRPPRRVLVEKRKWDDSVAARTSSRWLASPRGYRCWWTAAGALRERPRLGRVELVAAHEVTVAGPHWWVITARAAADDGHVRYHVDAAVPARVDAAGLAFCDLDIDLVIEPGSTVVRDGGDFRRRAREMNYPPAVRRGALNGLRDAASRAAVAAWPFDGWLEQRLREVCSRPT